MATASAGRVDLAVIGGGVNGCGIARDAAGRGLSVLLVEQGDLAGATSSASTKLIHGGLRYLEHYAFRLVREALVEREVLLSAAPHIVRPLRFVLPHHRGLRPWPVLRLGLFLYDHLGGRRILPGTRSLDLRHDAAGVPLKPGFTRGFEYSDCWVEDSRLVLLNARDAAARGAQVLTRTRCAAARRAEGGWRLTLRDVETGSVTEVAARALVNAAGPWVAQVAELAGVARPQRVRLVKGSHIVTRRLFDHDRCYIFQNTDSRIVFAIPYEDDFTLIGTTDQDFTDGDPSSVAATAAEEAYLRDAVGAYFNKQVAPEDVVWRYSGVRSLYDDGATLAQEATRDYVLTLDAAEAAAPILSVFGGKITTYRRLAEAALEKLAPHLPELRAPWTARASLPGGDFPWNGTAALEAALRRDHPFLDNSEARRLVRLYGTEAPAVLGGARSAAELGEEFGAGLTAREVQWQMREEWARSAEDVLWRRTRLGLRLTPAQQDRLAAFMASQRVAERAAE
ncbi:glycerol-3-phosphate dehydrogenase [Plastoroseomonas hellenica]|uniref:glycerol-3-phosphate dehydrogenase n=1 Tax=Plastoroseomonas hellenica TaxID=2687306 RepID=UPI001BA9A585|nr:glycerol-3-phosphate dehydrogenase [Plastoroseomonas hellenica]MBR0644794.1 glycerol-3-phosphate dehydrogenase [Plastoroseomonas hellenica]